MYVLTLHNDSSYLRVLMYVEMHTLTVLQYTYYFSTVLSTVCIPVYRNCCLLYVWPRDVSEQVYGCT